MRSFRSKPVGWRNESYRHYLAAKGIKTNYFSPLIIGVNFKKMYPKQRHLGSKKFDEELFKKNVQGRNTCRPSTTQRPARAGLWTSSVVDDTTDWKDFAKAHDLDDENIKYDRKDSFDVEVDDDARVFTILNKGDIRWLQKKYPPPPSDPCDSSNIDWKRFSEDFDAIRVSKFMSTRVPGHWDAESTAWFKKRFKEKELSEEERVLVKDRKIKKVLSTIPEEDRNKLLKMRMEGRGI